MHEVCDLLHRITPDGSDSAIPGSSPTTAIDGGAEGDDNQHSAVILNDVGVRRVENLVPEPTIGVIQVLYCHPVFVARTVFLFETDVDGDILARGSWKS